ncbi:MAG: DUF3105 domain-containing protein [Alphaproteobacteria bacterium]|nr:DUF3105 domain-containing protein [Alphaproteobacteria bacterium]
MAKSKRGGGQRKSKSRKGRQSQSRRLNWGPNVSGKQRSRDRLIVGVILAVVIVGGGAFIWNLTRATSDFDALAASGVDALERVQTFPSDGNDHLPIGQRITYRSQFPTSGDHDSRPLRAGFYTEPQWPERLVHSQEHGHIVIYYDELDPVDQAVIEEWTGLFTGVWDGVLAVPMPGIGQRVVLATWNRLLRLRRFDPAAAAAFIDAYRGRGPEQRVR